MMKSKDDLLKQATKAIKHCHWRKDLGGVPICSGECLPCESAIERGKCDTLIKLFRKTQKEVNINLARSATVRLTLNWYIPVLVLNIL